MQIGINNCRMGVLEYIYIIFLILYFLFPPIKAFAPFLLILIFNITYVLILTSDSNIREFILFFLGMVILLSFLHIVLNDTTIIGNVSNRTIKFFSAKLWHYFNMFFPAIMLYRVVSNSNDKQRRFMIILTAIILGYVSFSTLRELSINPIITRRFDFATNTENYQSDNVVGGYYFVYGITFVCLLAVHLAVCSQLRIQKISYIGVALFCGYFLIKAQFSIAMISTLVIVIILLYKYSEPAVTFIVFITSIIAILFLPTIINKIISVSSSELMIERLSEISTTISTRRLSEDGDMAGRFGLYFRCITSFLHSPLWGNHTLDFDGHSTYLQIWADLGVIGGVPLFLLILRTKQLILNIIYPGKMEYHLYFILLLIIGTLNPIHASLPVDMMICFFVPLILDTYNRMDKNLEIKPI